MNRPLPLEYMSPPGTDSKNNSGRVTHGNGTAHPSSSNISNINNKQPHLRQIQYDGMMNVMMNNNTGPTTSSTGTTTNNHNQHGRFGFIQPFSFNGVPPPSSLTPTSTTTSNTANTANNNKNNPTTNSKTNSEARISMPIPGTGGSSGRYSLDANSVNTGTIPMPKNISANNNNNHSMSTNLARAGAVAVTGTAIGRPLSAPSFACLQPPHALIHNNNSNHHHHHHHHDHSITNHHNNNHLHYKNYHLDPNNSSSIGIGGGSNINVGVGIGVGRNHSNSSHVPTTLQQQQHPHQHPRHLPQQLHQNQHQHLQHMQHMQHMQQQHPRQLQRHPIDFSPPSSPEANTFRNVANSSHSIHLPPQPQPQQQQHHFHNQQQQHQKQQQEMRGTNNATSGMIGRSYAVATPQSAYHAMNTLPIPPPQPTGGAPGDHNSCNNSVSSGKSPLPTTPILQKHSSPSSNHYPSQSQLHSSQHHPQQIQHQQHQQLRRFSQQQQLLQPTDHLSPPSIHQQQAHHRHSLNHMHNKNNLHNHHQQHPHQQTQLQHHPHHLQQQQQQQQSPASMHHNVTSMHKMQVFNHQQQQQRKRSPSLNSNSSQHSRQPSLKQQQQHFMTDLNPNTHHLSSTSNYPSSHLKLPPFAFTDNDDSNSHPSSSSARQYNIASSRDFLHSPTNNSVCSNSTSVSRSEKGRSGQGGNNVVEKKTKTSTSKQKLNTWKNQVMMNLDKKSIELSNANPKKRKANPSTLPNNSTTTTSSSSSSAAKKKAATSISSKKEVFTKQNDNFVNDALPVIESLCWEEKLIFVLEHVINDINADNESSEEAVGFYRTMSELHALKTNMMLNNAGSNSESKSNKGVVVPQKKKKKKKNVQRSVQKVNFGDLEKFEVDKFVAMDELKVLESNPDVAEKMMIQMAKGLTHCQSMSNTIDSILKELESPSQSTKSDRTKSSKKVNKPKKAESKESSGTSAVVPMDKKKAHYNEETIQRHFHMIRFRNLIVGDYVAFLRHEELWILARVIKDWNKSDNLTSASTVSVHYFFSLLGVPFQMSFHITSSFLLL